MGNRIEVKVPDIGDFEGVAVVEVLVSEGDRIEAEQSLISVESDKATMEVPSPQAGVVSALKVKVGDSVSEGDLLLELEPDGEPEAGQDDDAAAGDSGAEAAQAPPAEKDSPAPQEAGKDAEKGGATVQVVVPDIGDFDEVEIVELLVAVGDEIALDQSLISLESDKATMEVPSSHAGTVTEVHVSLGDKVGEGAPVVTLSSSDTAPATDQPDVGAKPAAPKAAAEKTEKPPARAAAQSAPADEGRGRRAPPVSFDASEQRPDKVPHASPSVRRFARELGVDLGEVSGSGRKGRITADDVRGYVKGVMQKRGAPAGSGPATGGLQLLDWPKVDFSRFGSISEEPLSRIKKISGANLARNWAMIPHVTHHDEADITEMEAFRKAHAEQAKAEGFKLTPLAFQLKAVVAALKKFPTFNASLDVAGGKLIMKHYFHIGVAVDTPDGLVVPVIRDCDRKSIYELASEVVEASVKARDKKLAPDAMQGGCFSISSLGGIGGTGFSPIINAPEVAILGVSRASMKPVWDGGAFQPRLMMPLSLSYDHRVIDGALAARFTRYLAELLTDIRRLLL